MRRFALLLLILPVVEIALFIKAGQTFGLLPTLALVIGAALLGGLVLRQQGLAVLGKLRTSVNGRELPGRTLFDALVLAVAAVLLVLPGFFSDFVALGLMVPPVRGWLYGLLSRRMLVRAQGAHGARMANDPRVRGPSTIDLGDDDYRPR